MQLAAMADSDLLSSFALEPSPGGEDRLREEAMHEGARHHALSVSPVWLESLGRLFAKRTPRPKAATLC
jgi:hypothetical protein